tara:strand:- start:112 stop:768 length:657 start_codon:yes stop_codon:yes gene_type:complete
MVDSKITYKVVAQVLPPRRVYEFSKYVFDFSFAFIILIFIWPILIIIAIAIKISSPGPVLYRGLRTGFHGKPFYINKFRSMIVGADKFSGTTSKKDSRVTPIGRVLRKNKLDELPQLINILKGEMSFVGPRPELPRYTERYNEKELLILSVRPGITDFSSLHFSNLNELIEDDDPDNAFETKILMEKNRLRLKYVESRSFFVDITLIVKTTLRVLRLI